MTGFAPVAMTIAGSDSSGGAGIEADLKTFTAFGVYGCTAITALTAQNTRGVAAIFNVPAEFTRRQIDAVAADLDVRAVKTGMLGSAETVAAVAAALEAHDLGPLVLDPVIVATSGDLLVPTDAVDAIRRDLVPRATVVTPNLHEAARLLASGVAETEGAMEEQARALVSLGAKAALIKGGHGSGPHAVDILATSDGVRRFEAPRLEGPPLHGGGCTLAAAIAARLAQGAAIEDAVGAAKRFVWKALESSRRAPIGGGAGPLDHLYAIRLARPPA